MKQSVDYTYTEVSDDQEGKHLFGYSTQTVKKCIARLEEKYFKGRNVFRNTDLKSDFLFRFEIKGLLLLLIKLELEDVFKSSKASVDGVSKASIEKLTDAIENYKNIDSLSDFEQRVLESVFNADNTLNFFSIMQSFKNSMSNFMIEVVKNYKYCATNFFLDIIDQFDRWSKSLIIYAQEMKRYRTESGYNGDNGIEKRLFIETNLDSRGTSSRTVDKEPVVIDADYRFNTDLNINLKNSVVAAINIIALKLYKFDENGLCSRIDYSELIDIVCKDDSSKREKYKKRLERLNEECGVYFESGKCYCNDPDALNYEEEDDGYPKLQMFRDYIGYLYAELFDIPKKENMLFERKNMEQEKEKLLNLLNKYFELNYVIQYSAKKKIQEYDADCFEAMLERGIALHNYSYNGVMIRNEIQSLEKYMVDIAITNSWPSPHKYFIKKRMTLKIKETVEEYFKKAAENTKMFEENFDANINKGLKDTEYECISKNIELLKSQCSDIMANMMSMILKIESNNESANDVFSQIFNIK